MKCQYCKYPNKEGWFYCKDCGKRASESAFTTNMYMRSDIGKRSDIEFSTIDSETHMNNMMKERSGSQEKFWKEKLNAVR